MKNPRINDIEKPDIKIICNLLVFLSGVSFKLESFKYTAYTIKVITIDIKPINNPTNIPDTESYF